MLAIYTEEDGTVLMQNMDDLLFEADEKGLSGYHAIMTYLHDCYVEDESGFQGTFNQWLTAMDEYLFE